MAGFQGALGSECYLLYSEQGGQTGALPYAQKLVKIKPGGGLQRMYEYYSTEEIRGDGAATKDTQGPMRGEGSLPVVLRADEQNCTFHKHCIGADPTKNSSTRLDAMLTITYTGADVNRTITKNATTLSSTGTTGGDDFSYTLANASYDTIGEVQAAIHALGNWSCALGSYALASDASTLLENLTAKAIAPNVALTWYSDFGTEGIWQHIIWASNVGKKENGLTFDQSMDIASFKHWGGVLNSFSVEIGKNTEIGGEWGVLTLGATTVGSGSANAGNAGTYYAQEILLRCNDPDATVATATLTATTLTTTITGGAASNLSITITDMTVKELVDSINSNALYYAEVDNYGDPRLAATSLRTFAGSNILLTNLILYGPVQHPLFSGDLHPDYKETIVNVPETYFVKIATGGVPGTATYYSGSATNPAGNETTTSATLFTPVYNTAGNDVGIEVLFPSGSALTSGDEWSVQTIRTAASVSQTASDPLSGNDWVLLIDGSTSNVSGVMSMSLEINNNFSQDKYEANINSLARMLPGTREVSGSFTNEFDSLQYLREWYADQTFTITSTLSESDYITSNVAGTRSRTKRSVSYYGPRVQILGDDPQITGPSYITHELPLKFLPDDTGGTTELRVTFISTNKRF